MKTEIGILGAGCWGIALANHLHNKGIKTTIWEISPERAKRLRDKRKLSALPWLTIPADIEITSKISAAIKPITLMAVPSQFFRTTLEKIRQSSPQPEWIISATKGLEKDTGQTMSQLIQSVLKISSRRIATLSGPSHAEEVSRHQPTAVIIASQNSGLARQLQKYFHNDNFRVYTNSDILGVELGGALKNVYAIAAGICLGLKIGDNALAALLTRAIAEMRLLGKKMNCKDTTFLGLSGVGDLIVTCFSRYSRNRLLGQKIGQGKSVQQALAEIPTVCEGYPTTRAAYQLKNRLNIAMPILDEVYSVLYCHQPPEKSIDNLMKRQPKKEFQ